MGFYDDDNDNVGAGQVERVLIGYDGYDKSEIYEGDDYVRDNRGNIYHRQNYVQMCLGTNGEIIDPTVEE